MRIVAVVRRFIQCLRRGRPKSDQQDKDDIPEASSLVFSPEEIQEAELYFFKKATGEVRTFAKKRDYFDQSQEIEGVIYFTGRLLSSTEIVALEKVMFDLNPTSFCVPVVDRYSPVAYSIMMEVHWSTVHHLNATRTYRESLSRAYIIGGRDLAREVRETCVFCRRFKVKMQEVEMGQIHQTRLTIAPAFTLCQVDLLGPYTATCEHNHRSTVKVWGVIFKCPASGAVFVCGMSRCDTSAFLQAYTRFAARFCHPRKFFFYFFFYCFLTILVFIHTYYCYYSIRWR